MCFKWAKNRKCKYLNAKIVTVYMGYSLKEALKHMKTRRLCLAEAYATASDRMPSSSVDGWNRKA